MIRTYLYIILVPYITFHIFRYAQAPAGTLRFKSPQAYTYEKKLIDVSGESKVVCSQKNSFSNQVSGVEDCLLLNIYIPDIALLNNAKLPVMFWIHGGSFLFGSGKIFII